MHLRYSFRIEPTSGQRLVLARTFGCARVVYNDALAARKATYAAGRSRIPTGELARRMITLAKRTPERAWLAEVSVDALQRRDAKYSSRSVLLLLALLDGTRPSVRAPPVGRPGVSPCGWQRHGKTRCAARRAWEVSSPCGAWRVIATDWLSGGAVSWGRRHPFA
ncbi:helix-turn-helix domain-containing protein [Streptomyces sp. NPDC002730]|uniref:helix-turn-helix domain-containing protein n=1 Tax=Streptomyces sp. NPDC002730 TaxID=3364662 RepID=UPI0036BD0352